MDPLEAVNEAPVEAPTPVAGDLQTVLCPRLDEADEIDLANCILTSFHAAIQDREEWESRLAEWEDHYHNRVPDKKYPWPGSSNVHLPLTMVGVETLKPRLVESVLGQQPPVIAVGMNAASEEKKDRVEAVLNWQVVGQLKLEDTIYRSAHLFLLPGTVFAKTYWKVDRRWKKHVREFPRAEKLSAILDIVFGEQKPTKWESTGDLSWEGEIPSRPRSGDPLGVKLTLAFTDTGTQVLVEQEVLIERPQVDLIEAPDVIVPVKGGYTITELPWIQHRLWMTEDELRAKARIGRFYSDAVEELLSSGTPRGDQSTQDSTAYRESQSAAEGVEDQGPSNVKRSQWDVLEDYRRYDIDGDGQEEEIITWVSPHAPRRILGWDYLDNVYAHGRRPIRMGRAYPIPFRTYGLSLAEVIRGIQDEINTIHNQRVDYATVQNLPFGFKRASATLPPISQRLMPGEFIDVDNPQQDIFIPKWSGSPAWANQEEAVLYQYFERLLGLTDLNLGRQPNRVGATRTAKGTQTLLSESGLRFKATMQAFQRFWTGIFSDILALDQEYMPASQEFRITGRRPSLFTVKDRAEIRGEYDIRLATSSENMNRDQMRQDATVLMQAVMNPAAIQVGIIGRKGVRRAYEDLLKSYGKDPDFYMEPDQIMRAPAEELMLFNQGKYVDPVMGENIQIHLMEHAAAMQDPVVSPEAKRLLRRHMQATVQLQQSQQMAQMLQGPRGRPPVGQQATNAAQGAQPQLAPAPGGPTSPNGGMVSGPQGGAY